MNSGGVSERPGDWIGPYRLLERIGEGGFGTVYLAERREHISQRVALKVIKPGMDTRAVVARFEQERQALAVMDHPFIAKVFDAGATPAGRPYFVMEHVAGEPITDYADRHNLSVRKRLELFAGVCEAVQHAHLKGIIHRDIKPSNILVSVRDGQPLPKVIDFGVAKAITHALTEKTIFTETGQLIGTPEYMSPEQAEMGTTDIDTRTDVYSLGVVLYELLSGLLPFDSEDLRSAGFAAICKVLREKDPPKPSTRLSTVNAASAEDIARHRRVQREHLATELRRELDWIPLKAIRKDRTERYQSPADLARDVRNYLEGKPLEAGPESAAYRMKKYIRRNKGRVAAAAAAVLMLQLVLGLAGTLWQATEAQRAAQRAGERAVAAYKAQAEAEARVAEAEKSRLADQLSRLSRATSSRRLGSAISPDGTRFLLFSGANVDLYDAVTAAPLATLRGHLDAVTAAVYSPDGARLLTASRDGTARVWDTATGADLVELKGHTGDVTSAAFSPDGTRIVTASVDHSARVWNASTGQLLAEMHGHTGEVYSASWSPDGTRVFTTSLDGTARIWDTAAGLPLAEFRSQVP
jgi:serine/threonine protein kinase